VLDAFSYEGKRVVVVGGATGMGQAVAEATLAGGAEVIVLDLAEVTAEGVAAIRANLADRGSIDAALAQLQMPIDALFLCAGVADGTPGIERINFVGHRYLIERLLDSKLLPPGSAIGFISSSAGLGWEANFTALTELLDIADFDEAAAWMRGHEQANYMGTKQAICAYVAREALAFLKQKIRINAICPGPTDTPLARANEVWLAGGADYREAAGIAASTPMEQALPLLFLCSPAAASIAGTTLVSDLAWLESGNTGSFPAATAIAELLLGRPAAYNPAPAA
jgi:NAD(P)-dependent dehydrogenase (short-subunit alcohol dehydrogenase family)